MILEIYAQSFLWIQYASPRVWRTLPQNSSVSMFERREEAEQRGQEEMDFLSKAAFQVHSKKRLS